MSVNYITYSGVLMKCLRGLSVRVTNTYNQRHRGGSQYALKCIKIIQMSIIEPLTSNLRSLIIYRQNG